ncbi:hypothetical protein sos41_31450 [Alphaproteobacteria bacterium SO-S41]|nr:hypothetical protein sos41_31450 [Alphaproteobacteria bacterium SO-S41]
MLGACSTSSFSGSAPDTVRNAVDELRGAALDCATPPAGTDLCWDGTKPALVTSDAPAKARCRAPVVFPEAGMSMSEMALRASALADWALSEQAKRLSRADWDARCKAAAAKDVE